MSFDLFDTSSAFLHFSDFENAVLPYALGLVYGAIALWVRAEAATREYVKPVPVVCEQTEVETEVDEDLATFVTQYEAADEVLGKPVQAYLDALANGFEEVLVETTPLINFPPLSPVDAADAAVMQGVIKKKGRKVGALIKDLWEESNEGNRLAGESAGEVVQSSGLRDFGAGEVQWADYGSFPSE